MSAREETEESQVPRECPHCGEDVELEETDVGFFMKCDVCGFEAADPVRLDFKTD